MTKEEYLAYLQTDQWKRKTNAARKRSGYRCQVCNGTDRLNVHHRSYKHVGREKLADLTVLCESCHKKYHSSLPQYSEHLLTQQIGQIVDGAMLAFDMTDRQAAKLVFGMLRQYVSTPKG